MSLIRLGETIKVQRERCNKSIKQLSDESGISEDLIALVEDNKKLLSVFEFEAIANVLHFEEHDIFFWSQILRVATIENVGVYVVGKLIRTIREEKGKHLREIAEYAGITVPRQCDIELGRHVPTPEEFGKICEFLEIPEEDKKDWEWVYFDECVRQCSANRENIFN